MDARCGYGKGIIWLNGRMDIIVKQDKGIGSMPTYLYENMNKCPVQRSRKCRNISDSYIPNQ